MRRDDDFAKWALAMGHHSRSLLEAGKKIGFNNYEMLRKLGAGERELTVTERLAMSALRAGLPPWTPENDHMAAGAAAFVEAVKKETSGE